MAPLGFLMMHVVLKVSAGHAGTVLLTASGSVARPTVLEACCGVPLRYVLEPCGAPPLPQGVESGGYHGKWIDGMTAHGAVVSRTSTDAAGGALGAGALLPIGPPAGSRRAGRSPAHWPAAGTAGQCGPCKLGLPAAAAGLSDVVGGGGRTSQEALRQVTQSVRGREPVRTRTVPCASSPRRSAPSPTTRPPVC